MRVLHRGVAIDTMIDRLLRRPYRGGMRPCDARI